MGKTSRCWVGALALLLAGQAAAQITLYGREDFRGRSVTIDQAIPDLEGSRFDERASSAMIRGGPWQLCSEPHYSGRCVTLRPGDYGSLRAMGLDNRITSVRAVGHPQPGHGIVFYERRGFGGPTLALTGVAESLGGFNDRARSLIVYDGEWELCEHDRFRGSCAVFGPGEYADLGALSGDVSSARPAAGPVGPIGGAPRHANAILYEGTGFRGRALPIDDNAVHDLADSGFNDRASSLRVERGDWLFCSGADFGGSCWTFGPGEYPTLPAPLENRVTSGRRIHDR